MGAEKMLANPTVERGFGELFASAKNALDNLQKDLASFLPSMPGMPVGKYLDLAIGIDIHATTLPPWPVCPVPHVGMVFDIMAAVVSAVSSHLPTPEGGLGAVACNLIKGMAPSVKVHGRWIAQAGIPIVHLPGFILHVPFPIAAPMSESEMFMGSSTVLADGGPCSTQFHPALSCNTVGFPPPPRLHPGIFKKPKTSLTLPTSMLTIITSNGKSVLVGGPPTIDLFQTLMKFGMSAAMKGFSKTKLYKKMSDFLEKTPLGKLQKKIDCILFGEPVDAVTGRVFHTNVDFELDGSIPLVWERTYYSDAEVDGPLGYNWHHSYNMGIRQTTVAGEDVLIFRHADGRESGCPALEEGETFFDRKEQLTWSRDKRGYLLKDDMGLYRRFEGGKNRQGYQMLSEIFSTDGACITFRYLPHGRLWQIEDSCGRLLAVESDTHGRVTCVATDDGAGNEINLVRYRYDEAGNMVETTDVLDVSKHFVYKGHQLVKLTNQSGLSFHWEYDGEGENARCVHTWGDGGVMEHRIEYGEGFTRETDGEGNSSEYRYDPQTKLVYKRIDGNNCETQLLYNEYGELAVTVNPEGYSRKTIYDEQGRPLQRINEDGNATLYAYDDSGNLIRLTTPQGKTLTWEYDEQNRVTRRTFPTGTTYTYAYKGMDMESITDSRGRVFSLHHNKRHELERLTYPDGNFSTWRYDWAGRPVQIADVKGNTTEYAYDAAGRLVRMEEADGNVHHFGYDASGNLTAAEDSLRKVAFAYGPMGVLTSRRQGGHSLQFRYDSELRLRRITNEGGERYSFKLDGAGRVEEETGFDGLTRKYLRDGAGRVKRVIRPGGRYTDLLYNGAGRVLAETQWDGSETAYAYDSDGLLLRAENAQSKVELKRDGAGRIAEDIQGEHSVRREFDDNGMHIRTTSDMGADIAYTHDNRGNLESMEAAGWKADWRRDHTGLETNRLLPGGVRVDTRRDRYGCETWKHVIGARGGEASRRYTWGTGGRLLMATDEMKDTYTRYAYDEFDNLIRADVSGIERQLETIYRAPDAIGNLYETKEKTDRQYDRGSRLIQDKNYFYHHDCEGNLIFKEYKTLQRSCNPPMPAVRKSLEKELGIAFKATATGWRYDWTAGGMLAKVTRPDGETVEFAYDALGRRTRKIYKGCATHFVWDGNTPLHEWTSKENVTTWLFEQDTFIPTAKLAANGENFSIVSDYMGTPMMALNSNGKKVWSQTLDIFGRNTEKSTNFVPFRYQGQYYDEETGLSYNRFRYYDDSTGQYISQDPIGLAGGNPTIYGYVKNTQKFLDIFGLAVNNKAPLNLGGGFQGRIDRFPMGNSVDFEIHVYDSSMKEVGIFGSDGWMNKHGITGNMVDVPDNLNNSLKGIAVDEMRKTGRLGPKGTEDISGDKWKRDRLTGAH